MEDCGSLTSYFLPHSPLSACCCSCPGQRPDYTAGRHRRPGCLDSPHHQYHTYPAQRCPLHCSSPQPPARQEVDGPYTTKQIQTVADYHRLTHLFHWKAGKHRLVEVLQIPSSSEGSRHSMLLTKSHIETVSTICMAAAIGRKGTLHLHAHNMLNNPYRISYQPLSPPFL